MDLHATQPGTPPRTAHTAPEPGPPPHHGPPPGTPQSLPPEALALADRLFSLARAGDAASLSPYLAAGVPPNLTNSAGDTLLMLAAYHGHAATVALLADHGADVNVKKGDPAAAGGADAGAGLTALAGAVFKGHMDVVGALVARGADPRRGRPSAVDAARMFGRAEACEAFGVSVEPGEGEEVPPGFVAGRKVG